MKLYEYVLQAKDQFSGVFNKLKSAAGAGEDSVERVRRKFRDTSHEATAFNNVVSNIKRNLVTFIAAGALMAFGGKVIATTAKAEGLKNAITFASGSAKEGAVNMKYLEDRADKLGLPLEASMQGFKTLAASMMGSKIQGQGVRDIFDGVSIGAAAMGLSSEQAEGAFLALGQMMGKGKVSAEELRGQLGERIPGAFQIAARSMNVTTAELDKMLKDGKIVSEKFLPKFAAEMKKTFEKALPQATQSMTANLNRMNNQWFLTLEFLGNRFKPVINQGIMALSGLLTGVRNNWEMITKLGVAVGFAGGAFLAYKAYVVASTLTTLALTAAINGTRMAAILLTGGFKKLNMVMKLNPIGLIVTAIFILLGALFMAYQSIDGFRGSVWGMFEATKAAFTGIKDLAVKVFGALGDLLMNVFNEEKRNEALARLGSAFKDYGSEVAKKFNEGYQNGVKNGKIEMPAWMKALTTGETGENDVNVNATSTVADTDGVTDITSGGKRVMNITVNLGKFLDKIEMNVTNLQEGLDDIEVKFRQMFSRIINGGIYSATQ